MYALRGAAISMSVFLMVYGILSAAVSLTWRGIRTQDLPLRSVSNFLFFLRLLPLITAGFVTAAFTIPSYLLLEPRAIDEGVGGTPLTLGLCAAMLAIAGFGRACAATLRAWRTISSWEREADLTPLGADIPVLRVRRSIPPMTAAGILRPRVLLSASVETVLTPRELQSALNHEMAHVRRRDNLKKLLFRFVGFPGMGDLELAWLEATEMAADDAAVSNSSEALDLAAALIKLSRLTPIEPPAELTAALVYTPVSIINMRVERLIAWTGDRCATSPRLSTPHLLGVATLTLVFCGLAYSHVLSHLHAATEWLMR